MNTQQALEQRITDLEIKASFAEDTVEQLNQTASAAEPGGFRSLRDELPPHY